MPDDFKSLIITADDFGRSADINAAIARYFDAGALTQTSLMVNETAVEDAVRIAAARPQLRVGLHLTLCDGLASEVSALTDKQRRFRSSPARAGLRYAFSPGLAKALETEIANQFARFRSLGFAPTYWDGHTHLHLHPTVFRLTLPIAKEHGFKSVRLVREPGSPALIPWIFNRLSAAAIPALQAAGIGYADRVFGLRRTGRMNIEAFREILSHPRDGATEIYFHPGVEADPPDPAALRALLAQCEADL